MYKASLTKITVGKYRIHFCLFSLFSREIDQFFFDTNLTDKQLVKEIEHKVANHRQLNKKKECYLR